LIVELIIYNDYNSNSIIFIGNVPKNSMIKAVDIFVITKSISFKSNSFKNHPKTTVPYADTLLVNVRKNGQFKTKYKVSKKE